MSALRFPRAASPPAQPAPPARLLVLAAVLLLCGAPAAAAQDSTAALAASTAAAPAPRVDTVSRLGIMPDAPLPGPTAASRSGLAVQPYLPAAPGWRGGVAVSYASVIEWDAADGARYLLDGEVLTAELAVRRDVGAGRGWLGASVGVNAAYDGAFDRFFDWYHARIGFEMFERDRRPIDRYADTLRLERYGVARARPRPGATLGDVRLAGGLRWAGGRMQSTVAVTLPTAPARSLFAREVPTVSLLHTARLAHRDRIALEVGGGVGYAPTHGELAPVQRAWFGLGSVAAKLRLAGGHAAYGTLFYHSATYGNTGLRVLDAGELSADFGYAYRFASGRELRIGLVEDILRTDQGIDLALRVAVVR